MPAGPAASQLRRFHPHDIPVIADIVRESLHENYDNSLYISLGQQWPDGFLVATDALGRPVAFMLGVMQVDGEGRILMFAVDREHRGRGIGTQLMQAFLERCRARSLRRVTLEVRVSNATAIRFYTDFRFSVIDLLRTYYSDGEDGYQMARDVA
ncbi:MAG: GNAT family N-acetyltransferase [Thermoplasmata archaeon]|nr:GNAT family N-acetyltransferase [Thermoplasmata archaeon]